MEHDRFESSREINKILQSPTSTNFCHGSLLKKNVQEFFSTFHFKKSPAFLTHQYLPNISKISPAISHTQQTIVILPVLSKSKIATTNNTT